jgi:hypothetical protein
MIGLFDEKQGSERGANQPDRKTRCRLISICCLLLCCLLPGYPLFKIYSARNQVQSFCSQAVIGMSAGEAEATAGKAGLNFKVIRDSSDSGYIVVWEGWAYARWFCTVWYVRGKVVRKEINFLD